MWYLFAKYSGLGNANNNEWPLLMFLFFGAIGFCCCAVVLFISWRFFVGRKVRGFLSGAIGLLFFSIMLLFVSLGQFVLADTVFVVSILSSIWIRRFSIKRSTAYDLTKEESRYLVVSYILIVIIVVAIPLFGYFVFIENN